MIEVRQVSTDKRGVVGLVPFREIHLNMICMSVTGWLEEEIALIFGQGLNNFVLTTQRNICATKSLIVHVEKCLWQIERIYRQCNFLFRI